MLPVWRQRVAVSNFAKFTQLDEITPQQTYSISDGVSDSIIEYLETLRDNFNGYISCEFINDAWARSPLTILHDQISDDDLAKDELIDICNNQISRIAFETKELPGF